MTGFKISLAVSVLSFGVVVSAFADSSPDSSKIDSIFPYYTMECSVTQLHPIHGNLGGPGGHALLYIKGACRDTSANYPKVKMCDDGTDLTSPTSGSSGVAISVDKILENTHFIAMDGKDFMFDGSLQPGQPVTEAAMDRTRQTIIDSGALNGVTIHKEDLAAKAKSPLTSSLSDEQYIAQVGADTDYAILFARTANCSVIPMSKKQIQAEVDYLNTSNEIYVSGRKKNDWNFLGKSCVSYTHNILAAAGIRNHYHETSNIILEVMNLLTLHVQVPKNEVVATEQWVNDLSKIKSAEEIYSDKKMRNEFQKLGTLPEMGGIFQIYPMDANGNTLYKKADNAIFVDVPFFKPRAKELAKETLSPRFNDVAANITAVRNRLAQIQAGRKAVDATDDPEFLSFATDYNKWIDDSIISLNQNLALLSK
jgi:hypothetical protein